MGISEAAEKLRFRTIGARVDLHQLKDCELPIILHWNQNHFVVLYKMKNGNYYISDPAKGLVCFTEPEF